MIYNVKHLISFFCIDNIGVQTFSPKYFNLHVEKIEIENLCVYEVHCGNTRFNARCKMSSE